MTTERFAMVVSTVALCLLFFYVEGRSKASPSISPGLLVAPSAAPQIEQPMGKSEHIEPTIDEQHQQQPSSIPSPKRTKQSRQQDTPAATKKGEGDEEDDQNPPPPPSPPPVRVARAPKARTAVVTTRKDAQPEMTSTGAVKLTWATKVALAESLGLSIQLPEPFEDIEWGSASPNPKHLKIKKRMIKKVEQLFKKENLDSVFMTGDKPKDFRIKKEVVELLIAIGVLRVLHQDYSCPYAGCYPVLLANFKKALQAYASYQDAALWFITKENPLQEPWDQNNVWTTLYPNVGCSHSPRNCHHPDGCRFFCNPKTLQAKGNRKVANRGGLNVVSLGSCNEFAYEESLVRRFGATSINSLVVFDCTVPENKLTALPKVVKDLPGYRYVNKCFVSHGVRGPPKGEPPFTAKDLVKETGNHRHIDLFKMDIEGSEFGAIHELLVEQLKFDLLGEGTPPTFSLLQFEMHLSYIGSKKNNDKKRDTVIQAAHLGHLCFLELHALGFMVARMERNPWFSAYSEVMLPHSSYFVESEVNEVFLP